MILGKIGQRGRDRRGASLETMHLAGGVPGLLYRRPIAYRLAVNQIIDARPGAEVRKYRIKDITLMLPNEGTIASLAFDAGTCATNTYQVTFTNGMPTRRDANRPSEIVGCLRIPLDILEAIIALPTELIQLKINYSSEQAQLLEAERKRIEGQKALQEARESIEAARRVQAQEGLVAP